jgi:hypothetical protein
MRTTRDLKRVWALLTNAAAKAEAARRQGTQIQTEPELLWVAQANITAIGIAERTRGGQPTGELAIKVYVAAKRPLSDVNEPVPRAIRVPGSARQVIVDVIERQPVEANDGGTGMREAIQPGLAICNSEAPSEVGTLGCFVTLTDAPDRKAFLSAAHVIARNGMSPPGTPILQVIEPPGGAVENIRIGTLVRTVSIRDAALTGTLEFDAAVGWLLPQCAAAARADIPQLGRPIATRSRLFRGERVFIYGATSRTGVGQIEDLNYSCLVRFGSEGALPDRIRLVRTICCTTYSRGGDSGAAVLSSGGYLVGLHFGTSPDGASVFFPIEPILTRFGAALAT